MKLLLIGAAALAVAGPAAAQYPPPPPPPSDADQYGLQQGPDDNQAAPDDQDQAGPDDTYDDQAGPPPAADQDQGRYGPPARDGYPVNPVNPGPLPQSSYGAGPDYEPADVLVQREDMIEQRIQRMAQRGRLDPRSADEALGELHAIQDEQDRMERDGQGLSTADQDRLSARLDDLQRRVKASRRR